jgi:hypothetical protein
MRKWWQSPEGHAKAARVIRVRGRNFGYAPTADDARQIEAFIEERLNAFTASQRAEASARAEET